MALQFGTVDGLVNISERSIYCFTTAINEFSKLEGSSYAKKRDIAIGTAFQRFVDKNYNDETAKFDLADIDDPVYTSGGKEQSPARMTFCKKMGLLDIDETIGLFDLTELGRNIFDKKITIKEYAFILLSKMGVFKNGKYADNVLSVFASFFQSNTYATEHSFKKYILKEFGESELLKTRLDILLNSLVFCGILNKIENYFVPSNTDCSKILIYIQQNSHLISEAVIDYDRQYCNYIGSMEHGVFDVLTDANTPIFNSLFPNLQHFIKNKMDKQAGAHQIILFGAPGTGKSHRIKELVEKLGIDEEKQVIRTTFHPDSDYSTFVGCYRPIMRTVHQTYVVEGVEKPVMNNGKQSTKQEIAYDFSPQAFIQAYAKAWSDLTKPIILVIEEINRGNCAQIFGDIFQLLDRDSEGFSQYKIKPDEALEHYLKDYFSKNENSLIPVEISSGKSMQLPSNLYIWATMNTSDQSLFPIDSAFKRRWDWKYIPIADVKKNYVIEVDNAQYDWWSFLDTINGIIEDSTRSEDKKLGYFFAKATKDGKISAETFVNKVIFYLWNDVFKDNECEHKAFKDENGDTFAFHRFFHDDGSINTDMVIKFLQDLEVDPFEYSDDGSAQQTIVLPNEKRERDKSRYRVNATDNLNKAQMTREVFKSFIESHPDADAKAIAQAWNGLGLKGIVQHLVETEEEFNERTKDSQDANKRAVEYILANEEKIYLSTQFGIGNIDKFVDAVNNAGWNIRIDKMADKK